MTAKDGPPTHRRAILGARLASSALTLDRLALAAWLGDPDALTLAAPTTPKRPEAARPDWPNWYWAIQLGPLRPAERLEALQRTGSGGLPYLHPGAPLAERQRAAEARKVAVVIELLLWGEIVTLCDFSTRDYSTPHRTVPGGRSATRPKETA